MRASVQRQIVHSALTSEHIACSYFIPMPLCNYSSNTRHSFTFALHERAFVRPALHSRNFATKPLALASSPRDSANGVDMLPKPLVVVGSVNADLVLPIERLPKPGETLAAASIETVPGRALEGAGGGRRGPTVVAAASPRRSLALRLW